MSINRMIFGKSLNIRLKLHDTDTDLFELAWHTITENLTECWMTAHINRLICEESIQSLN